MKSSKLRRKEMKRLNLNNLSRRKVKVLADNFDKDILQFMNRYDEF